MFNLKNRFMRSFVLLLIIVMLSACGKAAQSEPNATSQAAKTESAAAESKTRVYKDALGREVTIPAHAQRVVTTQYLPEMLAAGVKPLGAVTHLLTSFTSIKDQIGGIEDIGSVSELNLEKVLALQPELIIANEYNKDKLDSLSKIAPTVVVKWEGQDAFQHFKAVADVLGKNEKAEEWIRAFDQKAQDARTKLASYVKEGETFGVVVVGGYAKGQLRIYGGSNVGYTLFNALKFPMTEKVKQELERNGKEVGDSISLEQLPEFASADRLFLVKFNNDPDFVKEVDNSKLWNNLPAVKNNKVYILDEGLWFSYDVMSISAQIDDAIKLLSK